MPATGPWPCCLPPSVARSHCRRWEEHRRQAHCATVTAATEPNQTQASSSSVTSSARRRTPGRRERFWATQHELQHTSTFLYEERAGLRGLSTSALRPERSRHRHYFGMTAWPASLLTPRCTPGACTPLAVPHPSPPGRPPPCHGSPPQGKLLFRDGDIFQTWSLRVC